ncbi:NAD-dependent malic enzyme, partial [Coprococcus sp. MSK.21.13]|nr:NAD-dependent malic enzyme [Coprococcus sp. MSK.21.13]
LNPAQKEIAKVTNREKEKGKLVDVIKGKDIFIGVSGPKLLTKEMVSTMAKDSIVFAMANPEPEILPDEAKAGGARVVATGRSDFPNQINNVLVFPGIFRGALDVKAKEINEEMKIAAARGVANLIKEEDLNEDYIIPDPFNKEVAESVSKEVRRIAKEMNICK